MLLKYFYDKKLAQASYMVGCAATGEALIVDPMRDITPYLEAAEAEGLTITHVTETHIHADFVSGSRELAEHTGATLYLSDMGDDDWKYGYQTSRTILVRDGDTWMVGNIKVEVLHTPGHTPEHISFMITDTAGADKPIGIFTGDFLFVGDVGRPDLLEEAAGMVGTKEAGARLQYESVERFKQMADYLQIWPGHGAGSACGKALGAIPSTTLGYEKLFNPAFQHNNQDSFVEWLLDGQPEAPRYFAQMKKVNKEGPALLKDLPEFKQLSANDLQNILDAGEMVIDFRTVEEYAEKYIPGTINIPASSDGFSTYVGWFVDFDKSVYVIAPDTKGSDYIVNALRAVGVDNIPGYFTTQVINEYAGQTQHITLINANELAELRKGNNLIMVDVRGKTEFQDVHMIGSKNIPLGYITRYLDELPRDHTIVTNCASGYRSQIAASILHRHGFTRVKNLNDDLAVWSDVIETERA